MMEMPGEEVIDLPADVVARMMRGLRIQNARCQIPMDGAGGAAAAYGPQMGGWRSVSLPRTCSPDQTTFESPRLASTTGTGAAPNAIASVALAKLSAAALHQTTSLATIRDQAYADVALAHLLLKELESSR